MNRLAFTCCCCAVVLACSKPPQTTSETSSAALATPAALTMNDLVGKWNLRVTSEAGDSTLVQSMEEITPTGATVTVPNHAPIATRVTVSGDSVIADAGPYESVLRKGVQVTTHGVSRLVGGKLVGAMTGHYTTQGPDSVRMMRTEATRAQ